MMKSTFPIRLLLTLFLAPLVVLGKESDVTISGTNNTDCSCGYYDESTKNLFTDSIIVYFNETSSLDSTGFAGQTYENHYEKGWNDQYRQGADLAHLHIVNDSSSPDFPQSLAINISKPTANHLVMGGSIQTLRRDIHYGTFRAFLKSPRQWTGGSALSMELLYNETETFSLNLLSTEEPSTARITMLMNREFPDNIYGVNYTTLTNKSTSPWEFMEYRVDWTKDWLNYTLGDKTWRSASKKETKGLPSVPAPLHIKHWSTGDFFSMQGPPWAETTANVGWVRLFFNTTSMSGHARKAFDSTCRVDAACKVDDIKLRGFSTYAHNATTKWKQNPPSSGGRIPAIVISVLSGSLSFFLLVNAFLRRQPWTLLRPEKRYGTPFIRSLFPASTTSSTERITLPIPPPIEGISGPSTPSAQMSGAATPLGQPPAMPSDWVNDDISTLRMPSAPNTEFTEPVLQTGIGISTSRMSFTPGKDSTGIEIQSVTDNMSTLRSSSTPSKSFNEFEIVPLGNAPEAPKEKGSVVAESKDITTQRAPGSNADGTTAAAPTAKKRVDYLAGLVALSSLLVTQIHFGLTFVPAAINPGAFMHYKSEIWARKTVTPYLLNLIWIGPFLMTSSRFLAASYLKNGNLRPLAEKTVGRTPRLIIPIAAIALIEYFFMDAGATKWLMYLPSITWSTWPFTVGYTNFGTFISEVIELMYLIPNAAPQITFNYCTGVLWTIPVQLQGSWQVMLSVIVIREIKTPWKRFGYYAFCIVNNWYALSWGSYFWLGLMMADLDITYKWRKWLSTHPFVYYPLVLLAAVLGFGGLSIDLATQWTEVNYATYEYDIHPDPATGRPIAQTSGAGYPQYYVPKLHGLVFSLGFQVLVELSPLVQKMLSFKLFVLLFPHIFTIYLIHGFVYWSLGATICVQLSAMGLPYWANMLIVAVCCYAVIFLSLPLLTPVVETLGKNMTADIWRFAHEKPPIRKPTLYPFDKNLILNREDGLPETAKVREKVKGKRASESSSIDNV
ncbi:hypothetical protein Plec18167_005430 [Paecilomyces lecythidis]|uniref:GH16 domain-containing protein n=1 Tax=Paecilomyces lecythidis TaxID=3004212 RepID=A0ABR3XJM0_9EURO